MLFHRYLRKREKEKCKETNLKKKSRMVQYSTYMYRNSRMVQYSTYTEKGSKGHASRDFPAPAFITESEQNRKDFEIFATLLGDFQ